jgi:peroxiredoxin
MEPTASLSEPPRTPQAGEPAPFFTAATDGVDRFSLDVTAGRWIVLMFFGSLSSPASRAALELILDGRERFNGRDAAFWGVSVDADDKAVRGLANSEPGVRYFWDFDCAVSRLFGLADADYFRPAVFLIDPAFRIVLAEPLEATPQVLSRLDQGLADAPALAESQFAPILTLPRIAEPDLCATLIDYFRRGTPTRSGFAADVDGRTVELFNPTLKRRTDVTIEDEGLIGALRERFERRLFPMVKRAFGCEARHIERYLICRYGGEDQGFFFPHRDDVTAGSAHRKFAVSLNLNAEDYDGGDLVFPEFGLRAYRPPTGGATVFSCSLLHAATPVTRGERFVVVPFLFDDAGERLRQANLSRVGAAP